MPQWSNGDIVVYSCTKHAVQRQAAPIGEAHEDGRCQDEHTESNDSKETERTPDRHLKGLQFGHTLGVDTVAGTVRDVHATSSDFAA
ncbi:hypothetical protein GSI_14375 [Ganoderma sinense ZZ0214-1]|uniref:Uncharacterized protein n=1 Tax=Ganoderma sinense ZZ0214-1 TaxID=1077348 RepID=A0A2G8RP07_9APHY|nr:hypothetical protein GSI_14375 [Ganoderma sinense ZZ0214-1]